MQRFLVAGDNDDASRVHDCLRSNYTRRGCSVVYCATPEELIRQLKAGPPDGIFLHFQYAELTVYEIYQQIRSLKEGRTLPILVIETEMLGGTSSAVETLILLKMPLTVSELLRRASAVLHLEVTTTDPSVLCEPTFMRLEEEEGPDPAREAEMRRRQLLRQHSIQIRSEVQSSTAHQYLIPEQVRRRWFYNSDFVQGIFDRIEDSAWYQARCRRKYGGQAQPAEEPEPEEEASSTETSESGVPVVTPAAPQRDRSRAARKRGKSHAGQILVALLVLLVIGVGLLFFASRLLRSDTYCPQCGTYDEQVVWDIHRATCSSCGGYVGFACKCEECGHEFAFIPGLDVKTRFGASMAPPCPECGSSKTVRVGR